MKRRSLPFLFLSLAATLAAAATLYRVSPAQAQAAQAQAPERFDIVLANGRVLDGMGNPRIRADVGIRGDRVAAVGNLSGASAERTIDVRDLYVSPGFIDTHTHAGDGLATEELASAEPLLAQGVTTVFVNPDGGGPVDLPAQRTTFEKCRVAVNVAQFVPHGSVRSAVMGSANRFATDAEIEEMRRIVRSGMEAGAWGLSAGPFYVPGSYSDTREQVELARVAAAFGGAYQGHIRDESDYTVGVLAAVDEVITVAREARLPSVVTHIKAMGPGVWGFSMAIAKRIEKAREEGLEVWADHYPYDASATSLSAALVPRWAQADGQAAFTKRLADPATRAKMRAEMEENLARRGGAARIQFRRVRHDPSIEGRTLESVAKERGLHPVDLAIELLEKGSVAIVSFGMHEDDVRVFMQQPWTMTASDGDLVTFGVGVPHPRCYGTFTRKIRRYALDERVVTLEHAIRSMTSLPARVYRMAGRGVIEPGGFADLVVFDAARIEDKATYSDPHQLAEGVVHVFINGRAAVLDGRPTGERPGRVLLRGRD